MPVRNEQALYSSEIGNVFKSRKRLLRNLIPVWLASHWGRQEYVTHWWIGVTHNLCFDGFTVSFHKSNYNCSYEILAKSTKKTQNRPWLNTIEMLRAFIVMRSEITNLVPWLRFFLAHLDILLLLAYPVWTRVNVKLRSRSNVEGFIYWT